MVNMRWKYSRLETSLVLGQQRQRVLAALIGLQHNGTNNLHSGILRIVLGEILSQLQGCVGVACGLQGQGLGSGQVGGVLFAGNSGQDLIGLTKGNLGAELEYTCGELVLGGQGGGVEVDHALVLARVEGIVDVEELYKQREWAGGDS